MSDGASLWKLLNFTYAQAESALRVGLIIEAQGIDGSRSTWSVLKDELSDAIRLHKDRSTARHLARRDDAIEEVDFSDYEQQARGLCAEIGGLFAASGGRVDDVEVLDGSSSPVANDFMVTDDETSGGEGSDGGSDVEVDSDSDNDGERSSKRQRTIWFDAIGESGIDDDRERPIQRRGTGSLDEETNVRNRSSERRSEGRQLLHLEARNHDTDDDDTEQTEASVSEGGDRAQQTPTLQLFQHNEEPRRRIEENGFEAQGDPGIESESEDASDSDLNSNLEDEPDNIHCVICEEKPAERRQVSADCGHFYCVPCAVNFIETTMKDRTLFPPCCCEDEPLDLDEAKRYMTAEFLKRLDKVTVEQRTRNPLYCANRSCAEFIMPTFYFETKGICQECGTITCSSCRARAHAGTCRPVNDPELDKLRATAAAEGWQRCPACQTFVERSEGCLHMKCRCGTSFCYKCGKGDGACGYCTAISPGDIIGL